MRGSSVVVVLQEHFGLKREVGQRGLRSLIAAAVAIGALVGLLGSPGAASAAECTNTWTGPSASAWGTAGNWSAGHVPTEEEVACIGSGNSVTVSSGTYQVGVVQGEGSLVLANGTLEVRNISETSTIGGLALQSLGVLSGPGALRVSDTFTWGGEATMSGSGTTVLPPGVTSATVTGTANLKQRRFVNEATLTQTSGAFRFYESAEFANKGTFLTKSSSTTIIGKYTGGGVFINTGIFRKTAEAENRIGVVVENQATVEVQAGELVLDDGGVSTGPSLWTSSEGGLIHFDSGSFWLEGTFAGSMKGSAAMIFPPGVSAGALKLLLEGGTLGVPSGSVTISTLTMGSLGVVDGSGNLSVSSSLNWTHESTMRGLGSTTLVPGATATATTSGSARLEERRFINEGTFTMTNGRLVLSEGAELLNRGTFNANTSKSVAVEGSSGSGGILNTGVFQKTAGAATTEVRPDFVNNGTILQTSGKLKIKNPKTVLRTERFGKRSNCGDPVECATGDFYENQTDVAISGRGLGLTLTRSYSAQAAAAATSAGSFGYGWLGPFSDRLVVEGSEVTWIQPSGNTVPFTKTGEGVYKAAAWSQDVLSGTPELGFTLTRADQVQLGFSGSGRLEGLADRNGNVTTLGYDEANRLETIADPAGREITFAYNGGGQIESAEDPMGNLVEYAYVEGQLASVTLPGQEAPRWQFEYDGSHRITTMTDGRGGETLNEYDASDRVVSQTDPAGHTLKFEYEPFHTTITNESTGAITDQWFTSNNQPYSITRGYGTPEEMTEFFGYNSAGQLVSVTNAKGHTTTFAYDAQGNRKSEKDPEGNETKWTYNATRDVISTTTPEGETTTIQRDANGNVESVSRPAPEEATQTTTYVHDEQGLLESVTDPLERTWSFDYNEQGDRILETDPAGNTRTSVYDENSHLESTVTPRGNSEGAEASEFSTTIERDPLGRPLKLTNALGHSTEYAYDANGNLEEKTNANGHTTKYTYNANNKEIKVEKPNGAFSETGYDGAGNITSQTGGNEETTTYVRNVLGQTVEVIDPLNRKTIEEFDPAGNLKKVIDPAGRETDYSYDKAGRLIEIEYSNPATADVEYEYNANGDVTRMVDGSGESTYSYDELGRLEAAENGHEDVVGYDYNLADQITGILYPNGKGILRGYDEAGRLESVTDWLGGTTTFAYDADSNLARITFPAGTGNVDEFEYDSIGGMSKATFSKGIETLASLEYLRDKVGQVEDETRTGLPGAEEVAYGYDENERLIEAGAGIFDYDDADNLTEAPGTINVYDPASQLEAGTGIAYTFDKLGQRTEMEPSSGPATTYDYDQAGNLISIERPEEGEVPAIEETFAYDGTGLMTSKSSGMATHHLTWDTSVSQALLLADGQNSYIYGPNGLPITQISSEEDPLYFHRDQLGSTRMLTDASGEVAGTFSFSVYGAPEGSTGTATTPLGFAGQYTPSQTGLQYLRARFYDPATAQFMTKDPLAATTRSPYGYANQSPLHFIDPSGMACMGTTQVGPVSFPTLDPVDCATNAAGEAIDAAGSVLNFGIDNFELVAAPVIFVYCMFDMENCLKAGVAASAGNVAVNAELERRNSCFNFMSETFEDLVVNAAALLPGGVFAMTAGRSGVKLSPRVEKMLHVMFDGPGTGLEMLSGAKGR